MFVAALFAVSLLLLQLRRDAIRPGRMPRQFIWALLVLITFAPPAMTLWPLIEGGKRPLQRSWHLSGANLANTHLIEADLENAKLDRANLQGADLTRAHLRGTNFRNANLKSTKLGNADLREARLDGAVLDRETQFDEANLRYATARNTDLSQANMTPEQLKQICFTKESEQLPEPQLGFFRAHCSGRESSLVLARRSSAASLRQPTTHVTVRSLPFSNRPQVTWLHAWSRARHTTWIAVKLTRSKRFRGSCQARCGSRPRTLSTRARPRRSSCGSRSMGPRRSMSRTTAAWSRKARRPSG